MNLPLACADFAFPLLTHEHSLDVISMLGFDGVDIGLFEGRSHLFPSREFGNSKAAASLESKVSDCGLKVADVFLQIDADFAAYAINHPQADRRKKARYWFLRSLDYGRIVEAMQSSGYSGYVGVEYVWIDWQHCNEVDNLSETILFRDFFKTKFNGS